LDRVVSAGGPAEDLVGLAGHRGRILGLGPGRRSEGLVDGVGEPSGAERDDCPQCQAGGPILAECGLRGVQVELGDRPELPSGGGPGHRQVHLRGASRITAELPEHCFALAQGSGRVAGQGVGIDRRDPCGDGQVGVISQRHRLFDQDGSGVDGTAHDGVAGGLQVMGRREVPPPCLSGQGRGDLDDRARWFPVDRWQRGEDRPGDDGPPGVGPASRPPRRGSGCVGTRSDQVRKRSAPVRRTRVLVRCRWVTEQRCRGLASLLAGDRARAVQQYRRGVEHLRPLPRIP